MSFISRQIKDTHVVWLSQANRYMQLQEPAFRILEDWNDKLPEHRIISNCAYESKLPISEARRFVREVTGQLQSLVSTVEKENTISHLVEAIPLPDDESFITRTYRINGMNYRFRYSDEDLEEMIHPGFGSLEHVFNNSEADHYFDLFHSGDQVILQTEGTNTWRCDDSKTEYFVGLVFIQLLNCIHDTTDASWMGAVHASAVTAGKGAVLFTAPSGSGKSTFAAMLMNRGYRVLSDDFSPISIEPARVYPFPEGISVKNRSLRVLQSYFPSLAHKGNSLPYDVREVFLPIAKGKLPAPVPVTAIVFLRYTTEVDVEFKPISNLDALDRFLQQLWLPPTEEVASHFMDWYFQLPCYILDYSDTAKAIDSLSNLFHS